MKIIAIKYVKQVLCLAVIMVSVIGCKKHTNAENLISAPEVAHFLGKSGAKLELISATDSMWVKVAVSTNSTANRTVTIQPVSSTAVEGTHYTISKKVFTFKPGQLVDSFCIRAVDYTMYAAGRKDTINFNIVLPEVVGADFNKSFQLILRGPCFATDINIGEFDALLGTYLNSQDDPFGTPYHYSTPMTVKSWVQTSATTAKVVINNLWDDNPSWGDITFNVDFTDPTNVTVLPVQTITAGNAEVNLMN